VLADIACITAFDAAEYFGPIELIGVLEFFWHNGPAWSSAHDDIAFVVDDGLDMVADFIALVLDALLFGAVLHGLLGGHPVLF